MKNEFIIKTLLVLSLLMVLEYAQTANYLLFHSLAEAFSILVMFAIFIIVWNCRSLLDNGYVLLLAAVLPYVALNDFLHILAFKDMGVFPSATANLAPQLWLTGRYLECTALVAAIAAGRFMISPGKALAAYGLVFAGLLGSVFYWRNFPECFFPESGLTTFKIYSEYLIALIFALTLALLLRYRKSLDKSIFYYLFVCLAAMIGRELIFTRYLQLDDYLNYWGHVLKIVAFYCLYRAVVVTALQKPYALLWHELHKSEEMLRRNNEELELRVRRRTEELEQTHEALKQSGVRYRHMAYHDQLTGMPNWNWLLERLRENLAEQSAAGVLFQVEISNLKTVNDIFGHAAGDEVLRQLAAAMKELVGSKGVVVRGGGHQFILLLEGDWSEDVTLTVARGLTQLFDAPFKMPTENIYLNGAVGVASYPKHGQAAEEILKNLDLALNQAKDERKAGYCVFSEELRQAAEENLHLISDLREALKKDEFQLYYQPKVAAIDNSIIGFEALVRWNSPKYGFVMPGKFIPIAEQSGMIVQLGFWILQEACLFAKRLQDDGYKNIHIAVNISPRQLMQDDFVQQVSTIVEITQIDLAYLEIEITESVALEDFAKNVDKLRALRELGLKISLDDFGTGYSSLTYLKRMPINTLKLDREFISDVSDDMDSEKIIGALIKLAHEMGLNVIAEGVEAYWQAELLRNKGCDQMQGYLFSKPIPETAALEILTCREK